MKGGLAALVLLLPATSASAFCGDWNLSVAPGFTDAAWVGKWPVLLIILAVVSVFSTLILRTAKSRRAVA